MISTIDDLQTDADLETFVTPYEDVDDGKDHMTHIINPPRNIHIWVPGMTSQEIVQIARAHNMTVIALCDYEWVPKRNPEKYPVCQPCMDIAGELMRGAGE